MALAWAQAGHGDAAGSGGGMIRFVVAEPPVEPTQPDEITHEFMAAYSAYAADYARYVARFRQAINTIEALAALHGISEEQRDSMEMGDLIAAIGGSIAPDGTITLPDPWDDPRGVTA